MKNCRWKAPTRSRSTLYLQYTHFTCNTQDPFDRILIAQAMVEGITLLTDDAVVAQYPGPTRKV
jgi:PIN domain nuclease of toxin-antitoxin system